MSVIPNNLRADLMRQRIENKNTLAIRGSLYMGTGQFSGIGDTLLYSTTSLVPGANNYVLCPQANGLQYTQLKTKSFMDKSITTSKIANNAFETDHFVDKDISFSKFTGFNVITNSQNTEYILDLTPTTSE